jgi:Ca2+-binding RTX toxin-like protein
MVTKTGTNVGETLSGTGGDDSLFGLGGNDQLFGLGGNDTLEGGTGNDLLNGGLGLDTMKGGASNDTYVVSQTTDKVIELANEGIDLVQSSASFTLGANVENLTLIGAAAINGTGNGHNNHIIGNGAVNQLFGGTGSDILEGGAGNDKLDGEVGQDTMKGGTGNDTFAVSQSNDVVVELAGQGTDLVNAAATFTLSANVENLTLTGAAAINGTGNVLNNTIAGNSGNNVLNGLDGVDLLFAGAGNDTLFGGAGSGNQLRPGTGNDTVNGTGGFSIVSYADLAAAVTVDLVAGTTSGAAGTDTLIGIRGIIGSSAGDDIGGLGLRAGGDTLIIKGGGGNDRLYFGSGASDILQGDAGIDNLHGNNSSVDGFRIQYNQGYDNFFDFDSAQGDYIEFDPVAFNVGGAGFFRLNAASNLAGDANDRLIYNNSTDELFADLDGTGNAFGSVKIAYIPMAVLAESDFI